MARVNVIEEGILSGWFDDAKATRFDEATRWDGNNHISIPTGSQWDHETLFRTAAGRWIIRFDSQWQGRGESFRFVEDSEAKEWMILNELDSAAEKYFGEVEDERGPGRPVEVSAKAQVVARITEEQKAFVDANGGASFIRGLIERAMNAKE